MGLALKNSTIDKYFGFLTKLDIVSKKLLIEKLSQSIKNKEKSSTQLKQLFGAWEDDKSSDEIINEIRKCSD